MRSFWPEKSEISAHAEISGLRKLLRPKSPDENSSGRSLWKVCLNFFASIFLAPPPSPSSSIKAGWAYRSKLLRDKEIIYPLNLNVFFSRCINAQSASVRSLLAAESTAAETNAASSFERSPAIDQIYQILN